MASSPSESPLPPLGTLVGPWIVGRHIGGGGYGTVLRVVHKDRPEGGSYALKLALKAGDARFDREAQLLSRVRHPSVPRLEGRGTWMSPEGDAYPYVVMQLVEGISLYAWALEHKPTLRQDIGLLAQVARALQATHLHGVHRDVKGDNIRVGAEGHAVLLDFGSCWYPGASPLTGKEMPPGTRRYFSDQLLFFEFALKKGAPIEHYEAEPADDMYAFGMTAYRLLAGAYPPGNLGSKVGLQKVVPLKAPRGLAEACPELGELIERLLGEDTEARGSAEAVAEELEALREYSHPALDECWVAEPSRQPTDRLEPPAPRQPVPVPVPREHVPAPVARAPVQAPVLREHPVRAMALRLAQIAPRLALAGGCLLIALLLCLLLPSDAGRGELASAEPDSEATVTEQPDAGTSVGEEGLASVSPAETPVVLQKRITRKMPDGPLPGQIRPPCVPRDTFVEIRGGCWMPVGGVKTPCEANWYEYNGRCYAPFMRTEAPPTSNDP